jgi:hypothetical protein
LSAATYGVMMLFPANFSYWPFAAVMFISGIGGGLFVAPNTASIMNSVPARDRGAASGMRVTFNSTGLPLSMALFFTLLVVGLNGTVPSAMFHGLVAHGIPSAKATALSHLPPLSYVFAAFLGYNHLQSLLGPAVLSHMPPAQAALITSRSFFPQVIGSAFVQSLRLILSFAAIVSVIAAIASAFRGEKFVHEDDESRAQKASIAAGPVLATAGGSGAAVGQAVPVGGSVTSVISAPPVSTDGGNTEKASKEVTAEPVLAGAEPVRES